MFSRGFKIIMVLLMGLVWLSPFQVVSAASDTATFTFTSVTNPSLYLVNTTFQVSATGTNATYPPFGFVVFYADGVEISGCSSKFLNYNGSSPTANTPATCTINTLTIGKHVITANFYSYMTSLYDNATLTLNGGHTVSYIPLTITPDTLPDGQWMLGYSQTFSASGGTEPYTWSRSSTFPEGFTLYSNTGEMIGSTSTIGSSTFTVTVYDNAGGYGTKEYTLNITRATPDANIIIMGADSLYADTPADIYLFAGFTHPSNNGSIAQPIGTASYAVDGAAVAACSGDNARTIASGSTDYCTFNTAGLAAGTHTVTVDYTPTDENYTSATGTSTFTILPARYAITGMVFYDADKDGVKDDSEGAVDKGFKVIYDIECNGDTDDYNWSGNNISGNGSFSITNLDGGSSFCMTLELGAGETQTTIVGTAASPLTLDGDKYFELGVYYPHLIYAPLTLPLGRVNQPYSQTITISNGTAPYTISNVKSSLPDGITFNPETLTLSGTTSKAYAGGLSFDVTDATGFTDSYSSNVVIQTEGIFTLTSSANPAASGAAVTFTYTGSGEGWESGYSTTVPIPPIGFVIFYADGVAIDHCTGLWLNLVKGDPGNSPATCTINALTDGPHMITAEYWDMTGGIFTGGKLTMTQYMGVVKIYMPIIAMNGQMTK